MFDYWKMRVLVCGSRYFNDINLMSSKLTEIQEETNFDTIIHGAARGADTLAEAWAFRHGFTTIAFPADWNKYGKGAGSIRNKQMLDEGKPDLVVAFRGPNSRGTQNMIDQAEKAGVKTIIVDFT